jgi:hypothetical protein
MTLDRSHAEFEGWYDELIGDLTEVGALYQEKYIAVSPLPLERSMVEGWSRDLPRLLEVARRYAVARRRGACRPRYDLEELTELYLDAPRQPGINRPDGILIDGQLKLLEMNIDSSIGGIWEVDFLQKLLAKNPRLRLGPSAHFPTPKEAFLDYLKDLQARVAETTDGPLNLAIVSVPELDRFYQDVCQDLCTWVTEETGLNAHFFISPQMLRAEEYVTEGLRPYHIVYRHASLAAPPQIAAPMVRLLTDARRTKSVVVSDLIDVYIEQKGILALLSAEADDGGQLDEEEAELVRRYVPWTRYVADGETVFRGQRVGLKALMFEAREELVLKRTQSYMGEQVFIGSELSKADWHDMLSKALTDTQPWVVQENLASAPHDFEYYTRSEGFIRAMKRYTLSPFIFGRHFGGVMVRVEENPERRVLALPTNSQMSSAGVVLI